MKEGFLLNKKPSIVSQNGGNRGNSVKIILSQISGATPGKKYYQVLRKDNSILLIPENQLILDDYL